MEYSKVTLSKDQTYVLKFQILGTGCTYLLLLLFFSIGFVSCKDDGIIEKGEIVIPETEEELKLKEVNSWIEKVMRKEYLWNDEIPDAKELDFISDDHQDFFITLLSQNDGKHVNGSDYFYSYIEERKENLRALGEGEDAYGFNYLLYRYDQTSYYARVLYVLPDSPASEIGLKRGDWISRINNKPITVENYQELLNGGGASFQIIGYDGLSGGMKNLKVIYMTPSRLIEENPVYADTVLMSRTGGKRIAYLVYNQFATGPGGPEDHKYDNYLKEVFAKFKKQDVHEMVLDLRYNGGGYLSCAQLLASMIAPASCAGKEFCSLESNKTLKEYFSVPFLSGLDNENLNLNRLFVLTSEFSASASELIVNGLRPYMDVVLVGEKTEGKNVGSKEYRDDKYDWVLHPITSKLYNANHESDYENGFSPDYQIDELRQFGTLVALGNPEEMVLKAAINALLNEDHQALRSSDHTPMVGLEVMGSSLDRKKMPGVMLNEIGSSR